MIKSENHKKSVWFFFFKKMSGSEILLFEKLCCFTTMILWHVMSRAVMEQIVTQSRRLVEFSVSKWLKLTQFHLFTPLFDWKKEFCNGKTYKKYKKEHLGCKYLLLCVSKLEVTSNLPLAYQENSWTRMVSYRDYIQ